MIKFIKKNALFISLVFVGMSFFMGYANLNAMKDDTIIKFSKVSGDENLIKGIEISGVIQDEYSGISFKVKDNKVYQDFHYYDTPKDNTKDLTENNQINNTKFLFSYDFERLICLSELKGDKYVDRYIQANLRCERSISDNVRFMEEVNSKLYFVVPTCEDCIGKSAIYEVFDFKKMPKNRDEASNEKGYRKLADIDSKEGKVLVQGMFSVGDNNLAIVLIEANKLKVKAFNLKKMKFSEAVEIPIEDDKIRPGGRISGYANGDYLSLVIDRVYTLKMADEISVVNVLDICAAYKEKWENPSKYDEYANRNIADMIYKNDMLYVVNEIDTWEDERYLRSFIGERYLELAVFDREGSKLFLGNIEAPIIEDRIWKMNYDKEDNAFFNLSYNDKYLIESEHLERSFGKITISREN